MLKILWLCFLFTVHICGESHEENKDESTKTADHESGAEPDHEADKSKEENKYEESKTSYLDKLVSLYIPRMPYVMLQPILISIIKNGDIIGYFTLIVELKGKDVEAYRKLVANAVLVRDELFSDFFLAMNKLWIGPEPPRKSSLEKRISKKLIQFFKVNLVEKIIFHVFNLTLSNPNKP